MFCLNFMMAGHADAIHTDGIESEEDNLDVSGVVGNDRQQQELMDVDQEDVDTDAQQRVQKQLTGLLERASTLCCHGRESQTQ